ncbi:CwfJ C-terminus 1-domain-containing protein-like protein [Spinellus fusiger]|nr:CwfJ C-terminus 1-domain-containing protein-like protein [Spinellus fusiger]
MPLNAPAGVDILLTYEWPSTITHGSTVPLANPPNTSSTPIAEIAAVLKPRYHFSASENVFYEREPYKNTHGFGLSDEREADHVSRFIGLGNAFNTNKQRWFYAFNLVPLAKIEPEKLRAVPDTTTECPFKQLLVTAEEAAAGQKRSHEDGQGSNNGSFFWGADQKDPKRQASTATSAPPEHYICRRCNVPGHWVKDCPEANTLHKDYDQSVPPEHYVCNICHVPGHFLRQCPEKDKERDLRRIMASDNLDACWFCLANPKVAKHLIVSIGSDVYATLAKGPLVAPGAKDAGVPGGGHIILIPITHYPTFKKIPMEAQIEVVAELEKYKGALRRMFEQYDQDIVVFETSRESFRGMTHAHIQVVPIPKSKSHSLEAIIKQTAAEQNIKFVERFIDNPEAAYFKIDLPNAKSFVHVIPPKARFNMQFGRLLLAKALERPEREDWKACSQSEEEERNAVNAFKAAFKPYDFTI